MLKLTQSSIQYSVNTYPIYDSTLNRLSDRFIALLQNFAQNHRFYVWTKALSSIPSPRSYLRPTRWNLVKKECGKWAMNCMFPYWQIDVYSAGPSVNGTLQCTSLQASADSCQHYSLCYLQAVMNSVFLSALEYVAEQSRDMWVRHQKCKYNCLCTSKISPTHFLLEMKL